MSNVARMSAAVALVIGGALVMPPAASAASVTLVDNRVIIDNGAFYIVNAGDELGVGNFALNSTTFIDIPYAIFDFGATTSVSSATLTWDFLSLWGGSAPASISLYVGSDADGSISTADRFMGTSIDSFVYSTSVSRSFDVTDAVNAALGGGQYFAARLEAATPPASLPGGLYSGGQFAVPSLEATSGSVPQPVPEPGTLMLVATGALGLLRARRR